MEYQPRAFPRSLIWHIPPWALPNFTLIYLKLLFTLLYLHFTLDNPSLYLIVDILADYIYSHEQEVKKKTCLLIMSENWWGNLYIDYAGEELFAFKKFIKRLFGLLVKIGCNCWGKLINLNLVKVF